MLNFLDSLINVYDEKLCDKLCDEKPYGDKLCDEIYDEIYGEKLCEKLCDEIYGEICHLSVLWHPSTRLDVSILHLQLPCVPHCHQWKFR